MHALVAARSSARPWTINSMVNSVLLKTYAVVLAPLLDQGIDARHAAGRNRKSAAMNLQVAAHDSINWPRVSREATACSE